ncbi:MAG: MASE4 domain-containing protein [Telluria sp.]
MTQTASTIDEKLVRSAGRLAPFQQHAILAALLIGIVTTAMIPSAKVQWPNVAAFLPAYQTATISCYGVVAYLIFGYFRQTRLRALLYLWSGCLYTAAMLLMQFLSFPSAFVPAIRLLGGSQTTIWLWFFWHLGSAAMLFAYAWSEWRDSGRVVVAPLPAFRKCVALTGGALILSVLAVTLFHDWLPVVDTAGDYSGITHTGFAPLIQAIILSALLLLWRGTRFSTPMSAWLGVAMVALAFDNAITMAGGTRLSVGWYIGRMNALASALVMLALYLKEVNRVYARAASTAENLALANALLATEHSRLLSLFDHAPGFVAVLAGSDHRIQIVNAAFQKLVGDRDLIGLPIAQALPELDAQGFIALLDNVRTQRMPYVSAGMKISLQRAKSALPDDLYIDVLFQPNRDSGGEVDGIFIQGNDVTEQQRARFEVERYQQQLETLVEERTQKLEDVQTALMHAQKLEAVGKLTGGVAHDFNNVLHIINGNIDLIKMMAPSNEPLNVRCQSAQTAIKRGAKLSSQLLSFARKQPLQPDVICLNHVFTAIDLLLKRAVGERVEIHLDVNADAWNTMVDPQQLENVILNLALNASDAMPTGGKLFISIGNVDKVGGQFVHLAFRDTGEGMPPEVQMRAFEPFFSTKGVGKGTGLGLSMAYGFVKQSGGHIDIDSTLGAGTTINILLPRTHERSADKKPPAVATAKGGSETILVVDDEQDILANVSAMLSNLGYTVLTATSADVAVGMLDQRRIDLLFTDVIMPGLVSATDLAEQARKRHPAIRILFTSGYTENALIRNGRLDKDVNLLSKPYGQDELAGAVHKLLSMPMADNFT